MTGILDLPWWGMVIYTLLMTHITILSVTLYLHRCMAHRAVELHPGVAHFFRFWVWLTTGMRTHHWMAVHRKHHAKVDTDEDPHSPVRFGLRKVLLEGAELYGEEAKNLDTIRQYSAGRPDDWIENKLYSKHWVLGPTLMAIIDLALFGVYGITIWAVQMLWIPVLAAGVINGLGHHSGYRRFATPDTSTNIVPWGILIGGEELHNNHHAFASSARFSMHRGEFDIGWQYLRLLQTFKLAKIKKLPPQMTYDPAKSVADYETLEAIIAARFQFLSQYGKRVVRPVHFEELQRLSGQARKRLSRARSLLQRDRKFLADDTRQRLDSALEHCPSLTLVLQYQERLKAIWSQRSASQEKLLAQLQEWCQQAEQSGVKALEEFSRTIRGYSLVSAS